MWSQTFPPACFAFYALLCSIHSTTLWTICNWLQPYHQPSSVSLVQLCFSLFFFPSVTKKYPNSWHVATWLYIDWIDPSHTNFKQPNTTILPTCEFSNKSRKSQKSILLPVIEAQKIAKVTCQSWLSWYMTRHLPLTLLNHSVLLFMLADIGQNTLLVSILPHWVFILCVTARQVYLYRTF